MGQRVVAGRVFEDRDGRLASVVLSQSEGVTELQVDGSPSDASVPVELQRLGARAGGDFCVEAQRIDGDVWAVKVSPL